MTRIFTSYRNTKWVLFHDLMRFPFDTSIKMYTYKSAKGSHHFLTTFLFFSSSGHDTNSSRVCGVLLHVEEVGALWLLCATESVWEEEVQQLSWCNVSGSVSVFGPFVFLPMFNIMSSGKIIKVHIIWKKLTIKHVSVYPVTWWTGWWMKPRDWQWTVPPLCVQEQVEEEGWRPPQTNSSAYSTPSLPATSQVSNETTEKPENKNYLIILKTTIVFIIS